MSRQDNTPKPDGRPRVVIDWDSHGRHTVHADDGVEVFDRTIHHPDDVLYRYSPAPIPDGWLDGPIGYLGDGSAADQFAEAFLEFYREQQAEGKCAPSRKPVRRQ